MSLSIKNLYQYLIIAFVSVTLFSCGSTKETVNQLDQPLENALLWKIEGKDIKEPSYLFGTIHIIESSDFFYPDGTLSAIDQTDKMVFEIDMTEMNDMSNAMGLMKSAMMKDGKSLKDLLSDEDYTKVEAHFSKLGLPLFLFEKMKPMFLTVFASNDFDPKGLQNGSIKSYEMEFMEIANKSNKTMSGLETIEFQMSVFDSIPYEDQAKMLIESIETGDTGSDQFAEMIKIYKEQNIAAMVTMIGEDEGGMGNYEDILLKKRNIAWIPQMSEMMSDGPVFFAVGAGHLAGKNGVIKLLLKEGYSLTPVKKS